MYIDMLRGPAQHARRELRREQMARFLQDVSWLVDYSQIPERVTSYQATRFPNPYTHMASWMVDRLASWSSENHNKLHYGEVFEKHSLDGQARMDVRELVTLHAKGAYGPGVFAAADIHEAVPFVATREGIDSTQWPEIASKAKRFGELIAKNGTHVQAIIRDYFDGGNSRLGPLPMDVSRLKLDDQTGLTTVDPIEDVLAVTVELAALSSPTADTSLGCVALQVATGDREGESAYSTVWDAYTYAATNYIYPHLDIDAAAIPRVAEPMKHTELYATIEALALT